MSHSKKTGSHPAGMENAIIKMANAGDCFVRFGRYIRYPDAARPKRAFDFSKMRRSNGIVAPCQAKSGFV